MKPLLLTSTQTELFDGILDVINEQKATKDDIKVVLELLITTMINHNQVLKLIIKEKIRSIRFRLWCHWENLKEWMKKLYV